MSDKITASDLMRQAAEIHQSGKMPSLDEILGAVADTRKKYRDKILAARNPNTAGTEALSAK